MKELFPQKQKYNKNNSEESPKTIDPIKLMKIAVALDKKPWVMVAPMMSAKNNFIKHMKTKYDVITIGFSGWANSKKFGFSRGTDYSIPLSDHCDYNELIQLVKESGAERVYTIHGFVDEFALDLNKLGFSAQPLDRKSTRLNSSHVRTSRMPSSA